MKPYLPYAGFLDQAPNEQREVSPQRTNFRALEQLGPIDLGWH